MTTAALWLEITVAGFLFLTAGCVFILAALQVPIPKVLVGLNAYKDLIPFAAAAFVGFSFIIGTLSLRLGQVVYFVVTERAFYDPIRADSPPEPKHSAHTVDEYYATLAMIFNRGSERLH